MSERRVNMHNGLLIFLRPFILPSFNVSRGLLFLRDHLLHAVVPES